MADETLDSKPATGTVDPSKLPAHPDREYAYHLASILGGRFAAWELTGVSPNKKAAIAGYWESSSPIREPYNSAPVPSSIPPQWREVDSKSAFDIFNLRDNKTWEWKDGIVGGEKVWTDHPGRNGMENQPDWNWAPSRPADKPNRLK